MGVPLWISASQPSTGHPFVPCLWDDLAALGPPSGMNLAKPCFLEPGMGLAGLWRDPCRLMINVIVCSSDRGPLEPCCHTQLMSPTVQSASVRSLVIWIPVN